MESLIYIPRVGGILNCRYITHECAHVKNVSIISHTYPQVLVERGRVQEKLGRGYDN